MANPEAGADPPKRLPMPVYGTNTLRPRSRITRLSGLDDLWRGHLQLGTKHPVPETACHAEAILVISKVMLEVVLLQLLVVWGKPCSR